MNKPFYGVASMTNSNRSEIINIQYSQGPGSYNVSKQKYTSSLPKWSLKPRLDYGSCFKISKQNRPPPGSYQLSQDMKQKVKLKNPNYRSEKYKVSNEKLNHISPLHLPSSINTKNGTSFGYRDELIIFKENDNSPGPIYHVDKPLDDKREIKKLNTCIGFGFGERNGIYKNNDFVPGPGAYDKQEKQNFRDFSPNSSSFGKSPRSIQQSTCPLGPGQYNQSLNFMSNSGKTFKFKGKLPQAAKYINPNGPGTYDLPQQKNSIGPRFNHYRYKSNNTIDTVDNQSPSPFTYECKRYPEWVDPSKGFSLGKKINSLGKIGLRQPGPGTYQITENMAKTQIGGYMGRKVMKKKKINQQDCFGKYQPKLSASARQGAKFTFPTDEKPWNKITKDQTLGPAHYQVRLKRSKQSYSMGTSVRFKQLKKQPGHLYQQYKIDKKLINNSTIGYLPSYLKRSTYSNQSKLLQTVNNNNDNHPQKDDKNVANNVITNINSNKNNKNKGDLNNNKNNNIQKRSSDSNKEKCQQIENVNSTSNSNRNINRTQQDNKSQDHKQTSRGKDEKTPI